MSVEAITWALKQDVQQSSAKFVLVILANCTSGDGNVAFPSIPYIAASTSQDRKTVVSNLRKLVEFGLISDSGRRVGQTKQVIVYRLHLDVKAEEKRNSSENGTVPELDSNSTVFPCEQSRFSPETVPKTVHGTVIEPKERTDKSNRKNGSATRADILGIDLPDWIDRDLWTNWVEYRKAAKKPITTAYAAKLHILSLDKLRADGHTANSVIDNAIACGWQGLYAPKTDIARGVVHAGHGNKQQQLEQRNKRVADEWLSGDSPAARRSL